MARQERQFTAEDLYGTDGRPHAADIRQDRLFDCYFVAPIGILGEHQPDRIRNAIRFNSETGDFTVTLYRPPTTQERTQGQTAPIKESIAVSQADIQRNISKHGGGTADNNRDRAGALWPTVLEAGFAELYGRDENGKTNLNRGYAIIGDATRGGSLSDGMYALTGESGRNLQIQSPDAPRLVGSGPDHIARAEPPPFRAPAQGARLPLDAVYTEVEQALATGRPVSMATQGRDVRDGLEESHAYMVLGVARDPRNNDALVTLRNPYATNARAGEGNHNVGQNWNESDPEITVRLNTLVREGSFGEFNIGPAARTRAQGLQPTPQDGNIEAPIRTRVPGSAATSEPAAGRPGSNGDRDGQEPPSSGVYTSAGGPFNDPQLDRYHAAVLSGNSALADRIANDFAQSAHGQQMSQQGDHLLAQHQARETQHLQAHQHVQAQQSNPEPSQQAQVRRL